MHLRHPSPSPSSSATLQASELRLHGLMCLSLEGDEQAYRRFLDLSAGHLRAFLRRRMAGAPDAVEDVVQECLLAIHNQRHSYDMAAPLTSWLYAIAKYRLIDWYRRHARDVQRHEPFGDEHELFSCADSEAGDAARDLDTLLATLPAQERAAIVHTKLQGWSVRDAAAALRMSEVGVKVAVHRGLKTLAAQLRKQS